MTLATIEAPIYQPDRPHVKMSESVDIEAALRTSTEILETSRLEVLVPHASNVDITDLIQSRAVLGEGSHNASAIEALASIPQRRSIFYDESLPVFVIMEHGPEIQLGDESCISRIAISIEVVAVEGQSKSEPASRPNDGIHVLHVATLDDQNSTRTKVNFHGQHLSVWKVVIPLGHPRTHLSSPKVLFAVLASIKPYEGLNEKLDQDYLTSRNVFGVNLLEAYSDDSFIGGPRPQLSALRVSRVSPAGHITREPSGSISHRSKRMFHLFPALNVRLRHSEVGTGAKQNVIASLDIDITAGDVVLNKVGLTLAGGRAELVGGPLEALLPMACRIRDEVTFLYLLDQQDPINITPASRPVTLSLEASVLLSSDCHALIKSIWSTSIEISGPKVFPPTRISRAMSGPMQYGTTIMSAPGIRTKGPSPETSPVLHFSNLFQLPSSNDTSSLVITFSGPAKAYVGEVFTWSVFVVNRSSRPRKLALVVPHKRWKADSGKVLPPVAHDGTGYVIDEGAVYTAHRSQILEPAELVCLMNDVRIGPLAPLACHTTELHFVALTTGVLNVEGVRVVDISMNPSETTECRDLPSIISVRHFK